MGNCREITAFECNSYFTLLSQLVVVATQKSSEKSSGFISASLVETTSRVEATFSQQDLGIHLLRVLG